VLPYPNYTPSGAPKFSTNQPVSFPILGVLSKPKRLVGLGKRVVLRATMPKATINEYRQSSFPEHKIWIAENANAATPAGNFEFSKYLYQAQLSRPILSALNLRHHS